MKAPLSWLKEYVDITCTPEELKEKLFSCGFEVEGMEYRAKQIDRIVTCKILSIDKHPDADKLVVTQVDAGEYGTVQIVTAAKNISVGDIVPVALDGSTLFNGEHINTGKLRGVTSYGMFCSGEELGITDDWYKGASVNGILILDADCKIGQDIKEVLDLEDVMFDINVTANRPDCQSIFGLAREVAAVLGKPIKSPDFSFTGDKKLSTKNTVKVTNYATDLCSRYISHYVSDIKIEESPLWLKRRLFSMGIRSINNIVDITNFVLLELGQPMHAFDLTELGGNEINIRRANDNEQIITLDEKNLTLTKDNLVICDATKPVALAGVMGGLNSGIKDSTKNVVFESAKFARENVRRTSKALGIRSDSSSRYEKGVDAYTVECGMNRALHLIEQLGCGKIASDRIDICVDKLESKIIEKTFSKINGVLGITVESSIICDILNRLGFKTEVSGDVVKITVPLFRDDVDSYPDIAEEVIREYGYSHIKPTLLSTAKITNGGRNYEQKKIDDVKGYLISNGFNEIVTYSFVSEKDYDTFEFGSEIDREKLIKIINPIGEDMSIMRKSLMPSMVKTVCYNLNRRNFDGRLFEIAKVYDADKIPLEKLPTEKQRISFALFGEDEDFYTAKGIVEGITNTFLYGVKIEYIPCDFKRMHPTRSAFIIANGEKIGYFGQLNPVIAEKLDVEKEIYVGEIYYDEFAKLFNDKIVFKPISKYPIIDRDIALIIDDELECDKIIDCIKKNGGEFLDSVNLFDIYKGSQIGENKKSMAFNLKFVSLDRTLTVEEIDKTISKILDALKQNLNAELR